MAIMTTNFGELLYPGLKTIWGDAYKGYPEEYTQIFEVVTSDKKTEHTVEIGGFGYATEKPEGSGVDYDTAYQGYTKNWTNVTYAIGFAVTSEMWEDDQYGKIRALPKAQAFSVRNTIELTAANLLNNAFVTTYTTGPDALELCSTLHVLVRGGTEQNEPSTASDLSMTSLEQAMIDIGDMVNSDGMLAGIKAQKLIVPPEGEWTARQLLESDKDPETNFNAINPAKGIMPGGYTVNHWLTDPDAWFVKTDCPNGMVFYWRRRPDFTKDNEFSTENALFKTVYRHVAGWCDFRGIYGSPGA
jgi:phage major head subunit gpT-like protein